MDALEDVDPSGAAADGDDDEYNELEDLMVDSKKRGTRKRKAIKAGVLPKRFKSRSFASVLLEEANREDGVAREYLRAEGRLPISQRVPPRKLCPVTGQLAIYTDPKSGISYANLQALEQIRERAPPWMTLGGTAAYQEAAKSIRGED